MSYYITNNQIAYRFRVFLFFIAAHTLQSSASWLDSVRRSCDKRVGNSHKVCTNALKLSIPDCDANLGPRFNWLCNLDYVTEAACLPAKEVNNFFLGLDFAHGNILATVTESKCF